MTVITDPQTPDYAGPGISDACGICFETFDLTREPDQYPTVHNEGTDTWDLICEPCQDAMGDALDETTCPSCGSEVRAERAYVPGATGMPVSCNNDWHYEEA